MSHDEAVKLIVEGRGTHFDPAIVDAFLEVADRFWRPEISTGAEGSSLVDAAS